MSDVGSGAFSLRRDFRSILWGATLQYNLLRAACAGIVIAIVMLVVSIQSRPGQGTPLGVIVLLPFIWPIAFFLIMLPVSLVLGFLSEFIPVIGFVSVFYAFIGVTVGDPIVYILRRFAPRIVPVERPSFLSLRPIYYVLKPEETGDAAIAQ